MKHPELQSCAVCNVGFQTERNGNLLRLYKCSNCRSVRVEHRNTSTHDLASYWKENGGEAFERALYFRRAEQSKAILSKFSNQLGFESATIMDYGCGLGAFVSEAHRRGLRANGCDLSLPEGRFAEKQQWRSSNFTKLNSPWEVDKASADASCVVLLDVLEHHSNPIDFISRFSGAKCFVIKVPNARGPIATVASSLFHVNQRLYERLALVGDVAPHVWNFTSRGLDAVMFQSGFSPVGRIRLAELGTEASDRVRNPSKKAPFITRTILYLGGSILNGLSKVWSESILSVYWRTNLPVGVWQDPI